MSLEKMTQTKPSQINWKRNATLSTRVYMVVGILMCIYSPSFTTEGDQTRKRHIQNNNKKRKKSNVNKDHSFILSLSFFFAIITHTYLLDHHPSLTK